MMTRVDAQSVQVMHLSSDWVLLTRSHLQGRLHRRTDIAHRPSWLLPHSLRRLDLRRELMLDYGVLQLVPGMLYFPEGSDCIQWQDDLRLLQLRNPRREWFRHVVVVGIAGRFWSRLLWPLLILWRLWDLLLLLLLRFTPPAPFPFPLFLLGPQLSIYRLYHSSMFSELILISSCSI